MTPVEITVSIVTAVTPILVLVLRWLDKRQAAIWRRDDIQHKRRMELAAVTAASAATVSLKEVRASKQERAAQVGEIKTMIAENTQVSVSAFNAANHVNEKIASLGVEIAKTSKGKQHKVEGPAL